MKLLAFIKKHKRYFIIGLLIIVLLLIVRFVASIDFDTLKTYLREMPEVFLWILLVSFLAYLSATVAWVLCMGKEWKKIRFYELFMFKHVGEMLTMFNPTGVIAGESLKAVYLSKKGISTEQALSSILLVRVLIVLSGIFLAIISFVYLTIGRSNENINLIFILSTVGVLIILGLLLMKFLLSDKLYFAGFITKLRKKTNWSILTQKLEDHCLEINKTLAQFYQENKLKFLTAFLLTTIHWIFGALEFYVILQALDIKASVFDAVVVEMGVILFKTIGSVVPGQIGIEEYGNKIMLDAIGVVSNEVWLVASLMRRARQLFWLGVAGIFALIIQKTSKIK